MSEIEKMLAGQWYDANYDPEILEQRIRCMDLCFDLNNIRPSQSEKRKQILTQLLGSEPKNLVLLSPVTFDYGCYTHFGSDVFVNVNCYFMDGGQIYIGNHCFIGPNTGFYTAVHPLEYEPRNAGMELAKPIRVGDNCWIGGDVTILPGVTIGPGCVIGAGSVVTRDMPANHVCTGNPCRPRRKIQQDQTAAV